MSKVSLCLTRSTINAGIDTDKITKILFPWLKYEQIFLLPDVSEEMTQANTKAQLLIESNNKYTKAVGKISKQILLSG